MGNKITVGTKGKRRVLRLLERLARDEIPSRVNFVSRRAALAGKIITDSIERIGFY